MDGVWPSTIQECLHALSTRVAFNNFLAGISIPFHSKGWWNGMGWKMEISIFHMENSKWIGALADIGFRMRLLPPPEKAYAPLMKGAKYASSEPQVALQDTCSPAHRKAYQSSPTLLLVIRHRRARSFYRHSYDVCNAM